MVAALLRGGEGGGKAATPSLPLHAADTRQPRKRGGEQGGGGKRDGAAACPVRPFTRRRKWGARACGVGWRERARGSTKIAVRLGGGVAAWEGEVARGGYGGS